MSDVTDIETPEVVEETAGEPQTAQAPPVETAPGGADEGLDEGENGAENGEPTEASKAIAQLGLTRMTLQELKEKSPADLVAFAEQLEIENANSMRKQDMMFAILKTLAEEGVEIGGSGTLEVVQDGF